MENYQLFSILAVTPAILSALYVLRMVKKMNNFVDGINEELSENFFDYVRISERLDELEETVQKIGNSSNTQKFAQSHENAHQFQKYFIKKSLFNLDIPPSSKLSPEVLGEFFDEMIKRRWWKKPREED